MGNNNPYKFLPEYNRTKKQNIIKIYIYIYIYILLKILLKLEK